MFPAQGIETDVSEASLAVGHGETAEAVFPAQGIETSSLLLSSSLPSSARLRPCSPLRGLRPRQLFHQDSLDLERLRPCSPLRGLRPLGGVPQLQVDVAAAEAVFPAQGIETRTNGSSMIPAISSRLRPCSPLRGLRQMSRRPRTRRNVSAG